MAAIVLDHEEPEEESRRRDEQNCIEPGVPEP